MTCEAILTEGTVIEDFSVPTDWVKDANLSWVHEHQWCLDDELKYGVEIRHLSQSPVVDGFITKTTYSLNLSDMNSLRLDLRIAAISSANINNFQLYVDISSTTDFTKYWRYTSGAPPGSTSGLDGHRLVMRREDFVQGTGTSESWSNTMLSIRIGLHWYSTTTTWTSGGPSFYFDKLVKNSTSKALVCIGINTDFSTATTGIDALDDYGYLTRAWNTMVDYNAMGTGGESTMPELVAWERMGLKFYPMYTAWLLHAPEDPVRPIPPWPSHNPDNDFQDGTNAYDLSSTAMDEIYTRAKAIHDWYGLSWDTEFVMTHAGGYNMPWFASWMEKIGGKTYYDRYDISVLPGYTYKVGPQHHFMSFPIGRSLGVAMWSTTWMNGVSDVFDAIDAVIEGHGRYFCMDFGLIGGASGMSDSDFRSVLAYLQTKEGLGQVEVVSIHELMMQGMDLGTGDDEDILLGTLNLNDRVNYFVDMEGFDPGNEQTTWDEQVSYSGAPNVQTNVKRSGLVTVTIPMRVKSDSYAGLQTKLSALWAEVDKASNTLQCAEGTYDIVWSSRPATIPRDALYLSGQRAMFTLTLTRNP